MICLTLTGTTRDEWSQQIERNRRWIDLVELRVDLLKPAERGVEELGEWWKDRKGGMPAILTIRRSQDLGAWEGDEAQRVRLFHRLVGALTPEYIDIELDRNGLIDWDRLATAVTQYGGTVIRSHHETRSTPAELPSLMARLAQIGNEIPKLAVMAQSVTDTIRFITAAREFGRMMPGRSGIWIAMGEYGLVTRLWPGRTGSVVTFGSDDRGVPAAPGQVSPEFLRDVYRVGLTSGDSPAFAVVGAPIAHSKSPEFHNQRFAEAVPNGSGEQRNTPLYLPIRIDRFEEFEQVVTALDLRGVSITVPHKEAAYRFVEEQGGEIHTYAKESGVANTIWRDGGRWHADNTDIGAVSDVIDAAYEGTLASAQVLILGAGGAARGAIAAIRTRVGSITIANRTIERGYALADAMGIDRAEVVPLSTLGEVPGRSFDIIIQTTSVGMLHGPEGDPSEGYRFSGRELLFDVIYTPEKTPFLSRGAAAGCKTVNGGGMFQHQAARQYEIFSKLIGGFDSD